MTRTSSISGTFVKRQRSPVSVAAARSLSAAFLEPLIRTVPDSGRPPSTRNTSRATGSGLYSQWNGFASATPSTGASAAVNAAVDVRRGDPDLHGTTPGAWDPRGVDAPRHGSGGARSGAARAPRRDRRRPSVRQSRARVPPRAALPAPSRGRSRWRGRPSPPSPRPGPAGPGGSHPRSRTTPQPRPSGSAAPPHPASTQEEHGAAAPPTPPHSQAAGPNPPYRNKQAAQESRSQAREASVTSLRDVARARRRGGVEGGPR